MKILIVSLFAIIQFVYSKETCLLTIEDLNNAVFTAVDDPLCQTYSCLKGDVILTLVYDSQRISTLKYKAKDESSPKQQLTQTTPSSQNELSINLNFQVTDGFSTYNVMQICHTSNVNGKVNQAVTFKVPLGPKSYQDLTLNMQFTFSLIRSVNFSLLIGLAISIFL